MVAAAVVAAAVVGGVASNMAANKQAGAANSAANQQMSQYEQARADQAPWRIAGRNAVNQLGQLTATGGDLNRNFTMADFQADPGYAFRMQQGLQALQGSAAARGGILSGGALKGIDQYSQGLASQEYGNAFSRFETQNNDRYNRLASLAGLGQAATSATGQLGANAANNAGNYATQGANAQAAGYVGMANAVGSGLGNWMDYQNMSKLAAQNSGMASAGAVGGQLGAGAFGGF